MGNVVGFVDRLIPLPLGSGLNQVSSTREGWMPSMESR